MLIGITFLYENKNVIEQYQTHGIIIAINNEQGIVINKADGTGTYTIPPDTERLHAALPGEYRIRTTGEIVVNPDFTSTWTVYATEENTIEDLQKSGFHKSF